MIDPLTQLDSLQLGFMAFQQANSGMAVFSSQNTVLAANAAFHRLLGYTAQQLHGVRLDTLLHPRIHTLSKDRWETLREIHFLHHDGQHVEAQVTITPLDPSNTTNGSFLLQIHKTAVYRSAPLSNEISAVSDPSLTEILDGIPDGFVCLDSLGRFTYINKAAENMMLGSRDVLLGAYIWNSFPEAIGSPLYDHYLSSTATQLPDKLEVYCASINRWLEIRAYPNEHTYCAFLRDITLSKDIEREKSLQESEKMYRMIADNSTDMIARVSLDGVFLYISPASRTLLGYEPDELIGQRVYEYFHPEEFHMHLYQEKLQMSDLNLNLSAYRFRKKDGSYVWFESTARYILNEQGHHTEIISISRDISARKHVEKQLLEANELLQKMSTVDALTGVSNRRGFDECFHREWKQGIRDATPLSMILVDIDYFKRFNDSYGHAEGDICLKQVAAALSRAAERPNDFIARYGGEEFVLLLPETDAKGAIKVAEKLRTAVEKLGIVHTRSDTSYVTISLGTATMIPCRDADPGELFIRADKALYQAKQDGRNLARRYQCEA